MQKRTFFKRLFVGLLLAIIVCMGVVIYQLQASLHAVQTALGDNQRISVLEQAVSDNYYESVDDSKLMDGALKGYISALDDPYSGYLTNEEYHQWQSNEAGVSVGIGVTVTLTEDESGLQIVSVENPSPAKLAGLQADDIITAVDRFGLSGGSQSCTWGSRYQRRTDDSAWKNRTEKNGSAAGNASYICLWNDAGK